MSTGPLPGESIGQAFSCQVVKHFPLDGKSQVALEETLVDVG